MTDIDPEFLHMADEVYANASVSDIYTDTDDGNARRLINHREARFRRIADMKRWFVWDGKRWAIDYEDREVREATKELARDLPEDSKTAKSFKRNSMSSAGITSCIRMAETDPRVSILANEMDSWPELLNTPNGIVDLRTGEIEPHDPKYLLSRITTYEAAIGELHPRWDQFLAETFGGDLALVAYLRQLFGLALLGMVLDHILPFLHGTGANGKSVLTSVLQGLMGDADAGGYALTAPDGFLMAGRENKHETEMARLRGARLVVCSEQTSGRRFDEAKTKHLTGGDRLTGRFMRGDFFEFDASHLIWVMSNHLPEVKEGGFGFWRRVRRIPFNHVVPEAERVPDLHELLLKTEGPAILGWAVQGAVEVLANGGLKTPDSVLVATEEYRTSEDSLASFVGEKCMVGPHFWVEMSKFREAYEAHCGELGIEHLSAKAVGMKLRAEFSVAEGKLARPQRKTYKGIGLLSPDDEDDE